MHFCMVSRAKGSNSIKKMQCGDSLKQVIAPRKERDTKTDKKNLP